MCNPVSTALTFTTSVLTRHLFAGLIMASPSAANLDTLRQEMNGLQPYRPALADCFSDEDLQILLTAGFTDALDFRDATAEFLLRLGLSEPHVKLLKPGG